MDCHLAFRDFGLINGTVWEKRRRKSRQRCHPAPSSIGFACQVKSNGLRANFGAALAKATHIYVCDTQNIVYQTAMVHSKFCLSEFLMDDVSFRSIWQIATEEILCTNEVMNWFMELRTAARCWDFGCFVLYIWWRVTRPGYVRKNVRKQ